MPSTRPANKRKQAKRPTKKKTTKATRSAATKRSAKHGAKKAATKRAPAGRSSKVPPSNNEWFELRHSPIQGLGAFASKDIPRGTRIIEYVGEKISWDAADRRYDDGKMRRHHTFLFTLSSRTCVDAAVGGNASMYINHSCAPNCEAVIERSRIWIEAKKRIPAGTELVYDYQYEYDAEYTEEDLKFYACRCGAPNCRGTIVAPRTKSSKK